MESMCAQTRPRFILSSERVLGGMEAEPMLIPREKSSVLEAQRRIKPTRLHHTGQQAQHTTDRAILALSTTAIMHVDARSEEGLGRGEVGEMLYALTYDACDI